jgi:hypothetical protein
MTTWNKYMEDILKKWSSTSKTYSIMHSLAARHYNKWNNGLGIPVILLGAVASSSIFTTATTVDTDNIWTYINGGLVLLTTGLTGLSKFLGVNEKQVKHTTASFKYTSISMNIDTLLSFPRNDRQEDPRKFINEIKLAILEVREHSPNLPTWILSSYINKMDKTIINTGTKVNRHVDRKQKFENKQWNASTNYRTFNSTESFRSPVCTVPHKVIPRSLGNITPPSPFSSIQKSPNYNRSPNHRRTRSESNESINTNDVEICLSQMEDEDEKVYTAKEVKAPVIPSLPRDNINEDYSCYLDPLSEQIANVSEKLNCDSQSESSESEEY